MKTAITAITFAMLAASPTIYGQTDAFSQKIGEIKPNSLLSVWDSKAIATDNSGTEKKLLLGTNQNTFFCALSSNKFYRHGDPNRGGLECSVYIEGANWYLAARGPTHLPGTSAGTAEATCRAICIK
jgi:hypothetical protein